MLYFKKFKYCPVCGSEYLTGDFDEDSTMFLCKQCGYRYYQNMDPTVALIIPNGSNPNEVLLTKRNMNPGLGLWDTPGGFLKYGEDPENACVREIKEELGMTIEIDRVFDVLINIYGYQGVEYNHTTLYYLAKPIFALPEIADKQENSSVKFFDIRRVGEEEKTFAFKADIKALKEYRKFLAKNS